MAEEYIQSLIDKFKEAYALRILAKNNAFNYKIRAIMPVDKCYRLWRKDNSGNTVYYFNPGDSFEYSISNNNNAFIQMDENEVILFTLGVSNGMGIEIYNPQTTPLLGTFYTPDAIITIDKSPPNKPNPHYRCRSFRKSNYIVAPKMVAKNYLTIITNNPYIRIVGVRMSLEEIEKLPEVYTVLNLYESPTIATKA